MAGLSTRLTVMDAYRLTPDPCDNRIIAFNNFMQILSCICNILAMVERSFRDLAMIIDLIADVVFLGMMGCMTAQVHAELKHQKGKPVAGAGGGGHALVAAAAAPAIAMAQAQFAPAPQPTMLSVQVPPNAAPGTQIQVQGPDGRMVLVAIPPGAPPGSIIQVAVGAPPDAEDMER